MPFRGPSYLCCVAILLGCRPTANRTADAAATGDTAASATAAATPGAISLADIAGKWKLRATDEVDSTVIESELNATSDTSGWTVTLPGRKPMPVRVVAVAGDSIVTEVGPYQSLRVKGAQVTTRSVRRLEDGKLVGTTVARLRLSSGSDSVLRYRSEGTRIQ
jgi:hypothetical protein